MGPGTLSQREHPSLHSFQCSVQADACCFPSLDGPPVFWLLDSTAQVEAQPSLIQHTPAAHCYPSLHSYKEQQNSASHLSPTLGAPLSFFTHLPHIMGNPEANTVHGCPEAVGSLTSLSTSLSSRAGHSAAVSSEHSGPGSS